jgi:cold shock CspA family protein
VRYQGKITGWNEAKGYGFVQPNGGGTRSFVHIKSFARRGRRPVDGDLITYEVAHDSKNRPQAVEIRYPGERVPDTNNPENPFIRYALAGMFAAIVLVLTALGIIPPEILFVYVIVSGITFLAYAFDKAAAMNRRWRTK